MPMQAPTQNGAVGPVPGAPGAPNSPTPPSAENPNQPIIPDAGVYGAETAAAVNAYNNAVAAATAQRNALYNQYGLGNDGSVDPNNPYGEYQQLLDAQASQYGADTEDAASRGLRGGLAHQAESRDRRAAGAQNFQFQQQVASAATDYQNALANALGGEQSSISQAYNDALNTALQNMLANMASGNYTAPGTGDSGNKTGGEKQPPSKKPPVKKLHPPKKGIGGRI